MTHHQPPSDEMGARHQAREPDLLDWTEAAARRDSGMTRAIEHADRKEPEWSDIAMRCLLDYAADHAEFMAEDVREWAETFVIAPPPDGRAWGAVLQRAARAGHIVKIGYAPAKSSNLSPKVLWARA